MNHALHDVVAHAQRMLPLLEKEHEGILGALGTRARRDVARRALPGSYPYLVLFSMTVAVTGLASDHPATVGVLAAGMVAFTALRVLRCRAESRTREPEGDPPASLLGWVVIGQAVVWTYFACFTIHVHGMEWPGMLVLLCSASNVTGGLFAFAPNLRLSRVFTGVMIVPPIVMLLLEGGPAGFATALFVTLYAGFLVQIARIQHDEFWRRLETNELLRRHAEALAVARREAEQASRAKSTFLANISHELRTPLHGILSYARFGNRRAGKVDPEKLRDYFGRIESSGDELLSLFDDLLDLSRLEAGRMSCDPTVQRLEPVLSALADEFGGRFAEAAVELRLSIPDPTLRIAFDALRFKQVVRNLLANACRFAPEDSVVHLHVTLDGDTVRVIVDDEGPGVPEDDLERIFEKFAQSSSSENGAGSAGLGLTISRQLMALHGGRLRAENRPSGGARFVAELPGVEAGVDSTRDRSGDVPATV